VLGLEGAGKTSLLHCFASGSLEQDVTPTQGFNAVSINREDLQIEFLESKCNLHMKILSTVTDYLDDHDMKDQHEFITRYAFIVFSCV
jgi:ABC-type phosphate/phosphonate transport system ATPase subunit